MGSSSKNNQNDGQNVESSEERDVDFSQLDGEASNGGDLESSEPSASAGEDSNLRSELEAEKDRALRTLAEFENFKKRTIKERSELLKYQGEKIFQDLLEIVDDFELAAKHTESDPEALRTGVEMIHKKFIDFLHKWDVRGESAEGKQFDPNRQQAISKIPVSEGIEPGQVVSELKKAYMYKDKLIRVGEVVVAVESD